MDVLPSGSIFHELKVVHDTGYFDGKVSPEERWQQVSHLKNPFWVIKKLFSVSGHILDLEERKCQELLRHCKMGSVLFVSVYKSLQVFARLE